MENNEERKEAYKTKTVAEINDNLFLAIDNDLIQMVTTQWHCLKKKINKRYLNPNIFLKYATKNHKVEIIKFFL